LNLIPYLPAVGAGLVAGLLILVEARSVRLALLAIQYLAVALLSALALPLNVAMVKWVAGLMSCGILALTFSRLAGVREAPIQEVVPAGRWFRLLAILLVGSAALGLARTDWLGVPEIQPAANLGASLLMGLGLQVLFARTAFGRALRATSDDQETVQPAQIEPVAKRDHAESEENESQRGRGGKRKPCSKRSGQPRLRQADADADLAARRTGSELAQGDQIGVGPVSDPLAPVDEFLAKVAQVSDGSTEGSKSKLEEDHEHSESRLPLDHLRL